MKKLVLLAALVTGLSASAQDYKGHYGIGFVIGKPSGFSIKKFNNSREALQYTVGYNTDQNSEINLGVDFLLHNYDYIRAERGSIPLYYGLGVHVRSYENKSQIYARVPLGISYELNDLPLDIFFEFCPGLAVVPTPSLVINYGVGGRFFFDVKHTAEKIDGAI
ncbi:MAG TPA: hypothetical protein DIT65_08495 [Cryomorphaceae bacterium]|nr:hypothetical protein [Cryomorphaceae bacterium]|tara:strand:+ start:6068 stop:6559 length:492 start_codon:yes stop_codon:yes gene_type:complete